MPRGISLTSLAKRERPAASWPTLRRLLGYFAPYRSQLAASLVWLVLSSANLGVAPAIIGWIIDTALTEASAGRDAAALALPIVALFGSGIVGWYAQRMQILTLGTLGQRALFDVRQDVFATVQRLSIAFFETAESGDVMSRLINDVEQVNSFLSQGFRRVLGSALGVGATLVGMMLVDVRLALATLAVVPLMLLVTRLFGAIARRAFRKRQETIGEVSSSLAEELAGIKVAQAYARTQRNRSDFSERNAMNRDASVAAAAVSSAFSPVLAIITAISTALVALYGGWLATAGLVTVGVVVAFFNYARSFFNGISQLSTMYAETQSALAGAERVFGLIDTESEITDAADAIELTDTRGEIVFEHVQFRYATGPIVLEDLDLRVAAGEIVAIVGPTGAGKSTLVNLVPRFYDPVAGRVLIDGHDVRSLKLESLRRVLGVVLQEPFLFSGTIAENIRYGRLDASLAEIRAVCERTGADEFIERLPDGYDTEVGERGSLLSTGQRQLISIARALLTDPAILILDEATASIDTRTELLIQRALVALTAERTSLVIAHRLSTIRDADRIVVLDGGRIVETGGYAELLAQRGLFARLHEAQYGAASEPA